MKLNPLLCIDFYKADHRRQYPDGTTFVYSNLTARSNKFSSLYGEPLNKVVFFGLQAFIKDFLIESFNENFFKVPKGLVLNQYRKIMDRGLGKGAIPLDHISYLHDLGYLPVLIKAFDEGSLVPVGVPLLTISNTHEKFFWLTNYLETALCASLWKPITNATTALKYKNILSEYSEKTGEGFVDVAFQAHDFSFRGMSGIEDAAISGAAHLTSFMGTDSVVSLDFIDKFYNDPLNVIGCSVPATEHSVMCMGAEKGEINTIRRLITTVYPEGIVSIVCDTWDYWRVISEYLPELKDIILNRNGKLVIRPDSGEPLKIICGDKDKALASPAYKGTLQCLWETFGGHVNEKGYRVLNSKIGVIYGDSITLELCSKILEEMERQKFCSANVVFGIGSFAYQYVTRDTYSFAMKATYGVIDGVGIDIFKMPKTDDGTKFSKKGLLRVEKDNSGYICYENQSMEDSEKGCLTTVFANGELVKDVTFTEVRDKIKSEM